MKELDVGGGCWGFLPWKQQEGVCVVGDGGLDGKKQRENLRI